MTIPVAEAAAKKVAKHKVEESAKKKIAKKVAKKAVDAGKKSGKQFMGSKVSPKMMKAPVSYSVRKQHNILVGMWLATSIVYAFAYYNTDGLTIQTFFKRMGAIQLVFFVLSILVLFDTFAEVVGMFSILVFLAVIIQNGNAIIKGFSAFTPAGNPVSTASATATSQSGNTINGVTHF